MSKTRHAMPHASSDESDASFEDETFWSDSDTDSNDSECTHDTFASLAAALASMSEHFADLEGGFECVESSVRGLEKPALAVTVATYSQPGVLEAAPFRATRFQWKPEAAEVLPEINGDTTTFGDICQTLRSQLLADPASLTSALGLPADASFLEVLNVAMHRMVA
jgi:hypothetical protein